MKLFKKGQVNFNNLTGIAMAVGVLIVIVTVFAILIQALSDTQTTGSAADNVTTQGLTFFTNLTSQVGLLGTILILVLIVSVIVGIFAFRGKGRGGGL